MLSLTTAGVAAAAVRELLPRCVLRAEDLDLFHGCHLTAAVGARVSGTGSGAARPRPGLEPRPVGEAGRKASLGSTFDGHPLIGGMG